MRKIVSVHACSSGFVALALALSTLVSVQPAYAQGNDAGDLEERVAELEATTARKGNRKVSLTLSGHVNEAILYWDDGVEDNVYIVDWGDDDDAIFRFQGKTGYVWQDFSFGFDIEIAVTTANSAAVSQVSDDGAPRGQPVQLRESRFWIKSATLGRVAVGQGRSATKDIVLIDLGDTSFLANPRELDWKGDFHLRRAEQANNNNNNNGLIVNSRWREIAPGSALNFDPFSNGGLDGVRANVIRYDTPTIAGFTLSAAWGEDDIWDTAIRYAGEFGAIRVAAGVGYFESTDERNFNGNPMGDDDVDVSQVSGSASIQHTPTGLFVTGAWGQQDVDRPEVNARQDEFYYVKAGLNAQLVSLGSTTFYGEYYNGKVDMAQGQNLSAGIAQAFGGQTLNASEIDTWGVGIVQNIDAAAMQFYGAYRNNSATLRIDDGSTPANLEDMNLFTAGARIKF